MGHKKLIKFQAIDTFKNVLQYPEGMQGKWHEHFKNNNPIILELACGKGEYSVNLGRQNPDKNYIGVDIKGNRIHNGAKIALQEELNNVAFLRTHIGQITQYFAPQEVSEIWIVFSDPFLKKGKEKNRLTHERFLALYQQIAVPNAIIHLKTDSEVLFRFTMETIEQQQCAILTQIEDIYGKGLATGPLAIQTFYEKMHLADGRTIYYVSFQLPSTPIVLTGRFGSKEDDEEANDDEVDAGA
jgi:tRNA (guanine-N7-)-methyltransferase